MAGPAVRKPTGQVADAGLTSLRAINRLADEEKERIYGELLPPRLFDLFAIDPVTFRDREGRRAVTVVAPRGLGIVRIALTRDQHDRDPVFFVELADTEFRQLELSFCIIGDPRAPRFDVDVDPAGRDNWFASLGRNLDEEIRAMAAGLFPNQTRRGLRLFSEFFPLVERFARLRGMEMIVAEPLTYDNAIRYEGYGFDYVTGKRLMLAINEEFQPGGTLQRRLDGSSPFRMPGMERTVRGRSWAIHDGILDEPWDDVRIYKTIGVHAGVNTFPQRDEEGEYTEAS